MSKFITIRCKICGSVIYNLPENEFKNLKLVDLICEDCIECKDNIEFGMFKNSFEQKRIIG